MYSAEQFDIDLFTKLFSIAMFHVGSPFKSHGKV